MNTKMIALTILMACHISAWGQATLHGMIANGAGKPLQSATIALLSTKDSSVIRTQTAAADGSYTMAVDGVAAVIVRASAPGHATQLKTISEKELTNAVNFSLIAENTLKEVAITSKKPLIEEKVDRTIFNVENSVAATGGDAVDALKSTPGVLVMNDEITISGKSTVSVMINGRLQHLSGADLLHMLRAIPADNLSKIEVITNPPARYDAEGNSGMINLVTKKNLKNGLKGAVTASYLKNSLGNPELSTSLNYKKDALNLFCNINVGRAAEKYTNRTNSYYPPERWEQTYYQYSYEKNASGQFGAALNLSKKQIVGFQFTEGLSYGDNNDNGISNNYNADNKLDSVIRTSGTSREYYTGKHTLNLNYEWKIDSAGKKLNVDADYHTQMLQRSRTFSTQGYTNDGDAGVAFTNRMKTNPGVTIRSAKADMEWPLTAFNLSFGGKIAFVENTSENIYEIYNATDFVIDTTRTNEFSYHEQTQAIYINGQRSMGHFDMQAGLRSERTHIETYSPTTGLRNTTKYLQLFPTGYLQYKINDENITSINYSRRINRPGYNSLNPFRFYLGPNFYTAGNPLLRPSFVNGMEIAYRWKSKYSFKIFGRQTDNYWDRLYQTDSATSTSSATRANIGVAKFCGFNISAQFAVTKWWDTRSTINAGYCYYRLHYYNTETILTGINEWFETYNSFYLNKDKTISAELNAYYYTPRRKDYKIWADMSTFDINFRWLLLDKNLIIALHLEDLMKKAYWRQTNVINGTNEYTYDGARGGRLSVTYKFGNKNVKVKLSDHSNEEIQRANQ